MHYLRINVKPLYLFLGVIGFSLLLAVCENLDAAIALCIFLIFMTPSWILIKDSRLLCLRFLWYVVFICVTVTLVALYLSPDQYQFQQHRPFRFTGLESFSASGILGLFLGLLAASALMLEKVISFPDLYHMNKKRSLNEPVRDRPEYLQLKGDSLLNQIRTILVVVLLVPLNIWMFQRGLGVTGLIPNETLPFKLNGILTYLTKLFVPIIISILYTRTRRSSLLFLLFVLSYAIFLSVATASRASLILTLLFPLAFAWLDRRYTLLTVGVVGLGIGLIITNEVRTFIYIANYTDQLKVGSLQFFNALADIPQEIVSNIEYSAVNIFPSLLGRIEKFTLLLLASQADADPVGGPWALWLKSIDWRFADLGHKASHLAFLGYSVPKGLNNVGGTISTYALWAGNSHLWMIPVFSITSAFILVTFEWSLYRVCSTYRLDVSLLPLAIFSFTLAYYGGTGSELVNTSWITLFFLAITPRMAIVTKLFRMISL